MQVRNKDTSFYAFLLFLIWPFFSVLLALYEYREKWAKNIIWLYTAFYAYSKVESPGNMSDAVRYRMMFESAANKLTFKELVNELAFGKSVDFFKPVLEFLVSRFTDNYKIYFLIIGLIYGFFYSRNLWILIAEYKKRLNFISFFVLFSFSLIIPIWNLGGFRFWLAAQIFIYGILTYILYGKKKSIFFILFTPLIHFSFVFPVGVMLLYLLIGNWMKIFFIFFLLSSMFTEVAHKNIKSSSDLLPEVYSEKIEGYTNESYVESRIRKHREINWYVPFSGKALNYTSYFFVLILFWNRKHFISIKAYNSLFSFTLLFYGITNMILGIPSISRFLTIVHMLVFAMMFIFLQEDKSRILKNYILLTVPIMFIYLVVTIRKGFDFFGLSSVFGNPLYASLLKEQHSLIDYIKSLIM